MTAPLTGTVALITGSSSGPDRDDVTLSRVLPDCCWCLCSDWGWSERKLRLT